MKEYVLLPQPIEQGAVRLLEEAGVVYRVADSPEVERVKPLMKEARAVVLRTGLRMTAELMNEAGELLTVSRTGAGYDNVDVEAATGRGVIVTSSIGVNTVSVAEHTVCLVLALFKQLFLLDRELRGGNFRVRYANHPREAKNKLLGLVGFGRIGRSVSDRCSRAFGMRVQVYDPFVPEETRRELSGRVGFVDLDELFRSSDVISIHVPLTGDTRGLVDGRLLGLMKRGAFLVNTSRGGIVREQDLVEALKEGRIAGAALDVFEQEPVPPDHELLRLDNVILTPHAAALTRECVLEMAAAAVRRVIQVLEGRRPENIANPEVLSHPRWGHLRG